MHLGFIVEVELTKCGKCMQNIKENKRSALFAKTWKARHGEGSKFDFCFEVLVGGQVMNVSTISEAGLGLVWRCRWGHCQHTVTVLGSHQKGWAHPRSNINKQAKDKDNLKETKNEPRDKKKGRKKNQKKILAPSQKKKKKTKPNTNKTTRNYFTNKLLILFLPFIYKLSHILRK